MISKKHPFISIIFPNYNGGDFVLKTVDSLISQNYPKDKYETIIVDNGSTDGSRQQLQTVYKNDILYGRIRIIEAGKNIGAPAAYNLGIKSANLRYEYVLKMDNDLVLDINCLNELARCGESNLNYGVIGGKVYFYWDKRRIHAVGSKIRAYFGGGKAIGGHQIDKGQYEKDFEVDAVNGCMMLIKKEVIERAGLMDEKYFIYYDDHDWSFRISKLGYKHIYCAKALAWHNTKPNNRFKSTLWLYYATNNSFYFMKKNYSGYKRAVYFIAVNINILRYILHIFFTMEWWNYGKLLRTLFSAYVNGFNLLITDIKNDPKNL